MKLEQKIEAVLFLSGEPQKLSRLASLLKEDKEKIKKALEELGEVLKERGVRLMEKDGEYMLATAPELGGLAKEFMKEELGGELSRAALETLAVVVYRGPISKAEVDYIRGVNSGFSLRNLMVRGLIERTAHSKDARIWLYRPTFDFLRFTGIEKIEGLPHYEEFKKEVLELMKSQEQEL